MKLAKALGDANFHVLTLGDTAMYFSYETLVAIDSPLLGRFKTDMNYSKATTRQLNSLGGEWSSATPAELLDVAEQVSVQIAQERAARLEAPSPSRRPKL